MKNQDINPEMWKSIRHLTSSKYRTKVIKSLEESEKIPTQFSKDTYILPNLMSTVLKQLKDYELVECINPKV